MTASASIDSSHEREGIEPMQFATLAALMAACTPVVLYSGSGIQVAPIDLVGPVALIAVILSRRKSLHSDWEGRGLSYSLLWIAILIALIAVTVKSATAVIPTTSEFFRQLASMGFTFRPLIFFVLGVELARRTGIRPKKVATAMSLWSAFVLISVWVGLATSGLPNYQWGPVEYGGEQLVGEHLSGNLWGLTLYGQYGVNSLAETYAVYGLLCFGGLSAIRSAWHGVLRQLATLLLVAGLLVSGYLVVTSYSRQALLLLIIPIAISLAYSTLQEFLQLDRGASNMILAFGIIALVTFSILRLMAIGDQGALDSFSAGRVDIAKSSIETILSNPFVGTGFHEDQAAGILNNSHNLLLNLCLKMGVLAAFFYILFLMQPTIQSIRRILSGIRKDAEPFDIAWCTLFFVIGLVSNAIDITTASGPLLILLGVNSVSGGDR